MTRDEIIGLAREAYEDMDLAGVAAWLEENPGSKACGYLPVYAPVEVIRAAGMLPVEEARGLLGRGLEPG